MRTLAVMLTIALSGTLAAAAPNLYPDPSFETTGQVGVARTGEKAGYLKVGSRDHWAAIGGQVTVEPFARYRVTEWVKARLGSGGFFAPYCYDWDSYEWAFVSFREAPKADQWTRVEVTFVSPNSTMSVHPLAYIEAENCEAWVDDVVVEKIAEPAQVMAELVAKANPDVNEQKLIGRWLVKQGDLAGATKLMQTTGDLTRADLATVIAKATPLAGRQPLLIDMLAYGGPTYHDGLARFNELAAGLTPAERLSVAVSALKRQPNSDRCGRSVAMALGGVAVGDPLAPIGEQTAQLRQQRAGIDEALALVGPGTAAGKELTAARTKLDQAIAQAQAQAAALGKCRLRLAGRPVSARSHAIVVPDAVTAPERYAARDLRHHLELVTGELYGIKAESAANGQPGFYVGRTRLAGEAGVDLDSLGLEGIHLKTTGAAVVLAGNQRGCLYATYQFLEDHLNCRWFTPECATWPREGLLVVPALDRRYLPPLEFRAGDYPVAREGAYCARLRLNGNNHQMSAEQGGRKGVHSLAHTFSWLCPPERYFATHPEYFSLVNGRRQSGYAQLCLTNPDVLKIVIAGVRQWIKENPDMRVFSVSQNDTAMYCECDKCKAIAEAEGSQSGPMIHFVNAVAAAIAKDHPEVAIETLAYQYTRKPPKHVRPLPNVVVCLCSIECCFMHPLGTDEANRTFADDIRGWNRLCQRLWIWDYVINYAHSIAPFPNLQVLRPNVEFFIKNGVKGIYEESCYFTKGSELQELRNYVIAKTLWDPSCDTRQATNEFCAAFYGAAAGPLRSYLELIERETQNRPQLHMNIWTHPKDLVTPAMIAEATRLFAAAEAAVKDDPVLLHRVQVAELPMMYAEITLAGSSTFTERDGQLVQAGGRDVSALVDRFTRICQAEGVTMINEGTKLDVWLSSVPRQPRAMPLHKLRNGTLELDVLPDLGGRLLRLTHLPSGRQMLYQAGPADAMVPADSGYEEYTEGDYRSIGWSNAFTVRAKTERSITLEAKLPNGLMLVRQIELDAGRARVAVTSTLTNVSGAARAACLRSHPGFAVSATEKCTVRVLQKNGQWREISLSNPADPLQEKDEFLRDGDLPHGAWAIIDSGRDLALVNRFTVGQVAQALLNRNGRQARVNLELYCPQRTLAPGASQTLEQSFEVVKPAEVR